MSYMNLASKIEDLGYSHEDSVLKAYNFVGMARELLITIALIIACIYLGVIKEFIWGYTCLKMLRVSSGGIHVNKKLCFLFTFGMIGIDIYGNILLLRLFNEAYMVIVIGVAIAFAIYGLIRLPKGTSYNPIRNKERIKTMKRQLLSTLLTLVSLSYLLVEYRWITILSIILTFLCTMDFTYKLIGLKQNRR